jgi:hypothetical protein
VYVEPDWDELVRDMVPLLEHGAMSIPPSRELRQDLLRVRVENGKVRFGDDNQRSGGYVKALAVACHYAGELQEAEPVIEDRVMHEHIEWLRNRDNDLSRMMN